MNNLIELEVGKQYFADYINYAGDPTRIIFKVTKISNNKYNREIINSTNNYYPTLNYFIHGSTFHSYIVEETTANTIDELKELNPEYFI
jgi:hypothetical protein